MPATPTGVDGFVAALTRNPDEVARQVLALALDDLARADDLLNRVAAGMPVVMTDGDEARTISVGMLDAHRAALLDHAAAKIKAVEAVMGLGGSLTEYDPDDADDDPTPPRPAPGGTGG